MTRKYEPLDLPKLNRLDGKIRRYVTPEGNAYPSVTTVFSVLPNPHIDEWKKRVGEEEAERISKRAAQRGTYIHEQCEYLLQGGDKISKPGANVFSGMLYLGQWKTFRPLVNQIGDVLALETPLYSDKLKIAGTVDCVGYWNGKLSIIDFKTSSRIKKHEDIDSYWMQCAAYSCMLYERTGLLASQLVILMSVEDDEPLVFTDNVKNWLPKLMNLIKKFYVINGQLS